MNITIIGASAGIGLQTATRALTAGHVVTTLSRTNPALTDSRELHRILGSALDPGDVARAVTDADVVLVTLGNGRSRKPITLFTAAARILISTVEKMGSTAPVIAVTGFGAGNSARYQNFFVRTFMKVVLADVYQNKTDMEQLLTDSTLNWEIVRPGRLNNGRLAGYRVLTNYTHDMKVTSVSRKDVADYLVTESETLGNLHRYPALTS